MTDKEKMQKLFDAALRDPTEPEALKSTRAFSGQPAASPAAFQAAPPFQAAPAYQAAAPFQAAPAYPTAAGQPVVVYQVVAAPTSAPFVAAAPSVPDGMVTPMPNAGLDAVSSAELAILLEEQQQRKARRRRRDALVTALFLFGLTGGGYGWFVQSPQRVQAFSDAVKEIRSAGDIAGIVGKYKKALEKVKVRSEQIDSATVSMGFDPTKDNGKDPYFEEEMKQMMGGDGKTVGERNRLLKEKFGSMEKTGKLGIPAPSSSASIPSQSAN